MNQNFSQTPNPVFVVCGLSVFVVPCRQWSRAKVIGVIHARCPAQSSATQHTTTQHRIIETVALITIPPPSLGVNNNYILVYQL